MSKMPTPTEPNEIDNNSTFCSTVTEGDSSETASEAERITYPQDWAAYNEAQTNEKLLFLSLMGELVQQVEEPPRTGAGRPPANVGEMIFACCVKTYLNFSSRRTQSDLQLAHQLGYLTFVPHFNTVLKYLNDPNLTNTLMRLVEFTALPLQQLEDKFAVDSTGFSTSTFSRWNGIRGREEDHRLYVKAHVMCGVRTNVICSIRVTPGEVADSKLLPELVTSTAQKFKVREVLADKGYSSRKNLEAVRRHGGIPYIAFRRGATAKTKGNLVWRDMVRFFRDHKEEFLAHYHLRSNVESVFSMIKRKQGASLKTKSYVAQVNELLCKALVHNICVLIQEIYVSGVTVDFQALAEDELMCKSLA
jgi:transposase